MLFEIVSCGIVEGTLLFRDERNDVWQVRVAMDGPEIRRLAAAYVGPLDRVYEPWR